MCSLLYKLFSGQTNLRLQRRYLLSDVISKICEGGVTISFNTAVRAVWIFHPELRYWQIAKYKVICVLYYFSNAYFFTFSRATAMRLGFKMYCVVEKLQKGTMKVERVNEYTSIRRRIVMWTIDALQVQMTLV